MSLFVDGSSGVDTGSGTSDLFTISWNDGNLGQGADSTVAGSLNGITSISVTAVTYAPAVTTGKASADRLFLLANTDASGGLNWANPIVITPLSGGTDPYSGIDITGNGLTYVDTGVVPNVIHVVYDTSQAGGQGIEGFDTGGNPIATPNGVILYHELSHAYHHAINQVPFPQSQCPGNTSDEPAAEIDENVMRAELGLCLRDVCNHNGQLGWGATCGGKGTPDGPPLPVGSSGGGGGGGGCFIVTAAVGTADSIAVLRLRRIRDRLAARSGLAKRLIEAAYAEYFEFSPAIAAQIEPDEGVRSTVREMLVEPLFAWYELAECLAMRGGEPSEVAAATRAVFAACPRGRSMMAASLIASLLEGKPLPAPVARRLRPFAPMLGLALKQEVARWALFEPLHAVWEVGGRRGDLVGAVANWLAGAPIERFAPPADSALDRELQRLGGLFDFAPAARLTLGSRLAKAWPSSVQALRRSGFL